MNRLASAAGVQAIATWVGLSPAGSRTARPAAPTALNSAPGLGLVSMEDRSDDDPPAGSWPGVVGASRSGASISRCAGRVRTRRDSRGPARPRAWFGTSWQGNKEKGACTRVGLLGGGVAASLRSRAAYVCSGPPARRRQRRSVGSATGSCSRRRSAQRAAAPMARASPRSMCHAPTTSSSALRTGSAAAASCGEALARSAVQAPRAVRAGVPRSAQRGRPRRRRCPAATSTWPWPAQDRGWQLQRVRRQPQSGLGQRRHVDRQRHDIHPDPGAGRPARRRSRVGRRLRRPDVAADLPRHRHQQHRRPAF